MTTDQHWMQIALQAARNAEQAGEVPVGAVCVRDNELISVAGNACIGNHDPSAHAEVLAIRQAAQKLENYRLPGVTLYVTLEPCAMCVGAMIHARIDRLVFGATDPRTGSVVSARTLLEEGSHNHRIEYSAGVCAEESSAMLKSFFKSRRSDKKQ